MRVSTLAKDVSSVWFFHMIPRIKWLSFINHDWFLCTCQMLQSCIPTEHLLLYPHSFYLYLVNAPRPWQQLELRFGWELITPWRSPAKKEGMVFLKGRKLRFSFLGYFISYGQIRLHAWCDLFHVWCVPPAVISGPLTRTGNNFRSPPFNELSSWMFLMPQRNKSYPLYLVKPPHVWKIFLKSC